MPPDTTTRLETAAHDEPVSDGIGAYDMPVSGHLNAQPTSLTSSSTKQPASRGRKKIRLLASLLLGDVALAIVPYYLFRVTGLDERMSLLGGAAVMAVRVLYGVIRDRRLDGLASFLLVMLAASVALSLVTGDPRLIVVKDSAITALIGLLFVVSCALRKPLLSLISRQLRCADAEDERRWDALWASEKGFRRCYMVSSLVWGTGLLAEAAVRVPLVYSLPIDLAQAIGQPVQLLTIGLLIAWSAWFGRTPGFRRWKAQLAAPM